MLKKCFFCKKLVLTMGNYSSQPRKVLKRKKKAPIVGIRFKSPSITNRRRFSNEKIPTRVICKRCKSKDKKQKPLDYLVKALSNTISDNYNIEADTEFCPNDAFGAQDDIGNDEILTELDEVVTFDEENVYDFMTEEETLFWGGAVHTLDNIAVQQGILRELFDSAPEDIAHQPELFRELFDNVPEQLAERQRLMRGRDENIPELLADQQRLLRGVEGHVQGPIANEQRFLQDGDVPQHLAQLGLGGGVVRQPQQIEALQRLLPEDENNVVGPIAIQHRLRVVDENQLDLNVLQQRRGVGHINLPDQRILEERDNDALEQLVYNQGLFRVASDNISNQLAIHLGIRIGNGKLPHSFTVPQKILPEDDNTHDMLIVHRTLLQEDDHVQESDDNSQESIVDQQAYVQEDDSDVLDLLTAWQGLSLDDTLPRLIEEVHQLSGSKNSIQQDGNSQELENNEPTQYANSQNLISDTNNKQKHLALNHKLRSKDDINEVSDRLAIDQELINKGHDITQNLFKEKEESLRQTYGSDEDTQEPIDYHKKSLREGNNTFDFIGQIKVSADSGNEQEHILIHQKLPLDDDSSVKNQIEECQEFLQEGTDYVQQEFLHEGDNDSVQEVTGLKSSDCNSQLIALHLQVLSGNNDNAVPQEIQQVDDNKTKETIGNQPESVRKVENNASQSPTVQEHIQADNNNLLEPNAISQQLPTDENFPRQLGVQPIEDRQKSFLDGENNALKLAEKITSNVDDSQMQKEKAMHENSQLNVNNSTDDHMTTHRELQSHEEQEKMAEQQSSVLQDNNNFQFVKSQRLLADSVQCNIPKERLKQQPIPEIVGNITPQDEELQVDNCEQISGLERLLRVVDDNVNNRVVDVFTGQITFLGKRVKFDEEESAKVRKMTLEDSVVTRRVEESLL